MLIKQGIACTSILSRVTYLFICFVYFSLIAHKQQLSATIGIRMQNIYY